MTNVVIAPEDPLAQRLQTLLIDQRGFDVYGQWGRHGYAFQDNFVTLAPNRDPTNLFNPMSLAD